MSETTRRRRAVLATVVAVLLVVGGAALLGQAGRSGPPDVLHLAATASAKADAALAPGTTTGGSGYELVGTLPTEHPDTPAYTVTSRAGATAVSRLAEALGAGTPVREGDGWRSDKGLVVNADGSWWWSACADGTVSSDGVSTRCATAGGTGTVTPGVATAEPGDTGGGAPGATAGSAPPVEPTVGPLPKPTAEPVPMPSPAPTADEDTVLTSSGPVFAAVGLDVGNARVDGSTAVVDPVVGGLPTYGVSTRVAVAADGTLTDAAGWLVATARGDSYPVLTARQAFDTLPPLPRPAIACPVGPSGEGCPEPQPVQVTGARLGLALYPLADGGQVLVPAWLFAVKDWTEPVVGIAVEAKYLDTGTEPTTRPTPGTTDEPAPPPSTVREQFSFDRASRASDANAVTVQYGDSGTCPHENVTEAVKESSDTVVVLLEADPPPSGPCTSDYKIVNRVVKLQAPLGTRTVVDGATGKPVPLS